MIKHNSETCWCERLLGACLLCWLDREERETLARIEQSKARSAELQAEGERIAADLAATNAALVRAGVDPATLAGHGIASDVGRRAN
jgi:hypothetical protein